MSYRTPPSLFAPLIVIVALAGCFNLKPTEPTTRYYVLGSDRQLQTFLGQQVRQDVSVGLTRLSLAPYLESPRMVARHGTNRIQFAEFDRWGESLDRAIGRVVASHLARMLPFRRVEAAPWSGGTPHDLLVQLHVSRFEGHSSQTEVAAGSPGEVHLMANWEVIDSASRKVIASGTTDYRQEGWRVGDYASLVQMLDEALVVLSREIAVAMPESVE